MLREVVFKKSCPPCIKWAKSSRIPLAIPVLKPEYENITLPLRPMWNSAFRLLVSILTPGSPTNSPIFVEHESILHLKSVVFSHSWILLSYVAVLAESHSFFRADWLRRWIGIGLNHLCLAEIHVMPIYTFCYTLKGGRVNLIVKTVWDRISQVYMPKALHMIGLIKIGESIYIQCLTIPEFILCSLPGKSTIMHCG